MITIIVAYLAYHLGYTRGVADTISAIGTGYSRAVRAGLPAEWRS